MSQFNKSHSTKDSAKGILFWGGMAVTGIALAPVISTFAIIPVMFGTIGAFDSTLQIGSNTLKNNHDGE